MRWTVQCSNARPAANGGKFAGIGAAPSNRIDSFVSRVRPVSHFRRPVRMSCSDAAITTDPSRPYSIPRQSSFAWLRTRANGNREAGPIPPRDKYAPSSSSNRSYRRSPNRSRPSPFSRNRKTRHGRSSPATQRGRRPFRAGASLFGSPASVYASDIRSFRTAPAARHSIHREGDGCDADTSGIERHGGSSEQRGRYAVGIRTIIADETAPGAAGVRQPQTARGAPGLPQRLGADAPAPDSSPGRRSATEMHLVLRPIRQRARPGALVRRVHLVFAAHVRAA